MQKNVLFFFVDFRPKLAFKIPVTTKSHLQNINPVTSSSEQREIREEEFKRAYFFLKRSKSSGYDDVSASVVRSLHNEIQNPLFYIFQQSFNEGIFPEKLGTAKIRLIFQKRSTNRFNKLQFYFCLSMFLKVLENLMNNKLCNSLTANNILTSKQFGY